MLKLQTVAYADSADYRGRDAKPKITHAAHDQKIKSHVKVTVIKYTCIT